VVERGFARDPVTPWNLKDRPAALGSKRIGLDLRCSHLAPLCCWPGLPSEYESLFVRALWLNHQAILETAASFAGMPPAVDVNVLPGTGNHIALSASANAPLTVRKIAAKHNNLPVRGSHFELGEMCRV